ncbi:MAG: hypothetical protein CBB79_04355 [Synechococcus sp. TMED19]|nr:MAG: hypothetical protein CBB79_10330 [Synechococcus sp. TMED19]OUT73290.1 MAG: hypothetical protein CBB79_04355 [Synechococcus sp. TMED19]
MSKPAPDQRLQQLWRRMKAGERIRRRWPDPANAAADSAMADPLAPLLQHLHRSWQESPADP